MILFSGCSGGGSDSREVDTDIIDLPYSANGEGKKKKVPELSFDKMEVDAGRILQGDIFDCEFEFKNTGKAPLVISGVSASCGCTVLRNYPQDKIMPGEKGKIEVSYNSDNKRGEQVSVIAITANTLPPRTELAIRAQVVAPDKP